MGPPGGPGPAGQTHPARADRQAQVDSIDSKVDHLEDIEADLQQKIAEQIAAASGVSVLPPARDWPLRRRPDLGRSAAPLPPASAPAAHPAVSVPLYHEGIDPPSPRNPGPGGRQWHRDHGLLQRRLRQLHLRRSRQRALHLLRPPVQLRRLIGPVGQSGRCRIGFSGNTDHQPAPPPFRGPHHGVAQGSSRLPVGLGQSAGTTSRPLDFVGSLDASGTYEKYAPSTPFACPLPANGWRPRELPAGGW